MNYRKARTKHDKIKLMTYIRYIQQSWREKKEKDKKKYFSTTQQYGEAEVQFHAF